MAAQGRFAFDLPEATLAIARNTVLEAVREKVLYLLAGFALFACAASRVLAPLALGEGRRVTIDIGLAGLSLFGLLLIVFVGHSLVYRELERGSAAFLFSRPLGRGSFVTGKFLGLAAVLAGAVAGMGIVLFLVLVLSGYEVGAVFAGAIALVLLELWVLAALAILFAALASPILAGLFVAGAFLIGNAAGSLTQLGQLFPQGGAGALSRALLWIVPRFDLFQAAPAVVHGGRIAPEQWLFSVCYAALYATGALLLARVAFARRSLVG
ncbi:MAG: ABC transporter permease [Candidatus Eisenbacteria bacterium]